MPSQVEINAATDAVARRWMGRSKNPIADGALQDIQKDVIVALEAAEAARKLHAEIECAKNNIAAGDYDEVDPATAD